MTKIRIKRSNSWMNRARRIAIYIDNEKVGTISNNESKDFKIQQGNHTIRAKIDWCGSKNFDCEIKKGETTTLTIEGFKNSKWILAVFLIPLGYNVLIKHLITDSSKLSTGFGVGITIGAFLVLSYYLTFGRNSYLQIKEQQE